MTGRAIVAALLSALFAGLFLASAQGASAEPAAGYYIRDYHFEIVAGADRGYDVVETIDVWFEEPSRGIVRKIPDWSWLEKFEVSGFQAVGDPYVLEEWNCLRTGDADTLVSGQKTYTIRYTLTYFADDDPGADLFFMNLVDTEWGVRVEKFSARVTLPGSTPVEEVTLTSGASGKAVDGLADVRVSGNVITLESRQALGEWDGVALEARLPEGTFRDAAAWAPALEVERLGIAVNIDGYGAMRVEESYLAKVNGPVVFDRHISGFGGIRRSNILTYRFGGDGEDPEIVNNFTVAPSEAVGISITGPDGRVVPGADTLDLGGYVGQDVSFSINYTLVNRLRETMGDVGFYLQLMKGYFTEMRVDRLDVSIDAPFDILRLYGGGGGSLREILGEPAISGGSLAAQSIEPFENQDISYVVEFEGAGFLRRPNTIDIALPIALLAAMFCVLFFALMHKREKPVVPVVGFYPPEGMNPAEVGYVIDERVTGRDVTSLIYYWASHGHLKIEIASDKKYVLHRVSGLDAGHAGYEHDMFSSLWGFGGGPRPVSSGGQHSVSSGGPHSVSSGGQHSVSSEALKDRFYPVVKATAGSVRKSFSGERGLYRKGRSPIVATSFFIMCIGFTAFAIMGQFVDYVAGVFPIRPLFGADKRFGEYENDFYVMFIAVLFALLATLFLATNFYRSDRALKSVAGLIRRLACLALGIAGTAMFTVVCGDGKMLLTMPAAVSAASLFIIVNSLPFIARLSEYGVRARGLCLGFKAFLNAAEKQRLEMLLADNPDYYYNTLAYAQVLGVSKIWQRKFDRLAESPSSWLFGAGVDQMARDSAGAMKNMANGIGRRRGRRR